MLADPATQESEIRGFLGDNFLLGDAAKLKPGDSLLEAGIVDSTGVLELIDFLEARYDIEVTDDELLPENLDSIANIIQYLNRKLSVTRT